MLLRDKRLVCGVAAVLLAFLTLAGCSAMGEPSSTEDLLVRFAANPNNTNFVTEGKADLSLTLAGYRAAVPIEGTVRVAGDKALCDVSVDLSSFAGEKREYEVYVEAEGTSAVGYLRDSKTVEDNGSSKKSSLEKGEQSGDGESVNDVLEDEILGNDAWNKAKIDVSFEVDIPLVVEILSEARFMRAAYASDDQIHYDLTIPASDVVHALLSKGEITTSFYEVDEEEITKALGDSKLHVCFNKDCLIRTVSLDLDYTYDDKDTIPLPVRVGLEIDATFDGYGTVDLSQVTASDSVRNVAADTSDPFEVDGLAEKLQKSAA